MAKIKYNLKFPTSVYSALEIGNKLYVGGSDWNRRKVPYSKKIAEKSKGVLYILDKTKSGYVKMKKIIFPSMIYTILRLSNKTLFIGCKSRNGAYNLINSEGEILKQKDDKTGRGIYNSVLDKKRKEILLTTRSGKLEIIDSKTLELKSSIQVTSKKTRLWSIDYETKDNKVYLGDYAGVLYILHRKKLIKKINLKKFHLDKGKVKEGWGPSLWGIKSSSGIIILGDRWGSVIILNKKNLDLKKQIRIGEDISCIEGLSKTNILIGTRYGKLFLLDLKSYKSKKILEIKPPLQKENAIWGMSKAKDGVLVCFADGNVCKISS